MLNIACVGWIQPTASQCNRSHQPSLLPLSWFWEEDCQLFQRVARIQPGFTFWLSLQNFPRLVALTFAVWTFHISLKKSTQQMARQHPAWPPHLPGPSPELGFKGATGPTPGPVAPRHPAPRQASTQCGC